MTTRWAPGWQSPRAYALVGALVSFGHMPVALGQEPHPAATPLVPTAPAAPLQTGRPLTLEEARRLASARQAPLQDARVATASSRRVDAERTLRDNPVLYGAAGPRLGPSTVTVDLELGIEQPIPLAGGRGPRVAIAEAGVRRASAEADDVQRAVDREVGFAFVDALWAQERARLADANVQSALTVDAMMARRVAGGDATELERIAASSALARRRSELVAMRGVEAAALARLRAACGLARGSAISVAGDLQAIASAVPQGVATGERLPEVRALRADRAAAIGELDLGDAQAWPVLGVGARYGQEEASIHIIQGTLSLSLPFFDRGAGTRAEARARMHQVDAELAVATTAAEGEQAALSDGLAREIEAARALDAADAAMADKALAIARTRLAAGEDRLVDVLLLQGEMQALRADRLDRWRDAARTALDLEHARGGRATPRADPSRKAIP